MKNRTLLLLFLVPAFGRAQAIVSSWIVNTNGQTASYWQNTAGPGNTPSYVFHTTTDSANVIKVCYNADSVWIKSHGMTNDMGQYQNPGTCVAQDYIFRLPRNPTVPVTKTISPKVGAIGVLINGIPIYGITNANSWDAATSSNLPGQGGDGIWNVEVYLSEGHVLDTAFGAHPQQQGAYHTHATPWRLYESSPAGQHSPIVGFAFDGYPVYGPYGYTDPMDAGSGVSRMQTGYSLRNITQRHTLPDGTALTSGQYGPDISTTYPLGFYCEDYEWLSANGGNLDEYNGRFCITPEYPMGTYAYFVTMDAAGTPEFPYYIGIEYYGQPDLGDFPTGGSGVTGLAFPSSGLTCALTEGVDENSLAGVFQLYPNPVSSDLTISCSEEWNNAYAFTITSATGATVYSGEATGATTIRLGGVLTAGVYLVTLQSQGHQRVERIVVQ